MLWIRFDGLVRLARRVLEGCGDGIQNVSDRFAACLLQNCSKHGLETPTPVQIRCWPLLLRGHSLRVTAATGTGKTLAYLLPTLLNVLATPVPKVSHEKCAAPNALIIVPSSELAFQVQNQALRYGQPRSLLRPVVLCGGVTPGNYDRKVRKQNRKGNYDRKVGKQRRKIRK